MLLNFICRIFSWINLKTKRKSKNTRNWKWSYTGEKPKENKEQSQSGNEILIYRFCSLKALIFFSMVFFCCLLDYRTRKLEARIWLKIEINKKHKVAEGPKVYIYLLLKPLANIWSTKHRKHVKEPKRKHQLKD